MLFKVDTAKQTLFGYSLSGLLTTIRKFSRMRKRFRSGRGPESCALKILATSAGEKQYWGDDPQRARAIPGHILISRHDLPGLGQASESCMPEVSAVSLHYEMRVF